MGLYSIQAILLLENDRNDFFRKLRFREPVDDRSPEPNNNQTFEEDLPAEPIPTIDMDIPSDPTGDQIKDISNLKTKVSNL